MIRENKILAILLVGVMMGTIDTTIVLLALPSMTAELHTTLISSIWVILIYLLVVAVTTTQFGKLGDIYGRSKMFNLGFVIFTIGSLLCGLSPGILYLILFRVIQGIRRISSPGQLRSDSRRHIRASPSREGLRLHSARRNSRCNVRDSPWGDNNNLHRVALHLLCERADRHNSNLFCVQVHN